MTTKKTLKWRLTKLPTAEELLQLVEAKIITAEEAKDVLFSEESKEDIDAKALQEEIKFLRNLVDTLSAQNRHVIVEKIREVEVPYRKYQWYGPYNDWSLNGSASVVMCNADGTITKTKLLEDASFNQIRTF